MNAIYSKKSGSPNHLTLTDRPLPEPKGAQILVRVSYASVTRGDVLLRTIPRPVIVILGLLFGFKPMDIPGIEFSGVVEKIGPKVDKFKSGDKVSGTTTGLRYGANAQFVLVDQSSNQRVLVHTPEGVSDRDATLVLVGGMTALQITDRVRIKSSDRVLIYGASGSVGSFALQIARAQGAVVHGVCGTQNMQMVKDLGAEKVFDYSVVDWAEGGQNYDVIIDGVGKLPSSLRKKLMAPGARFASTKAPTKEKNEFVLRLFEYLLAGTLKVLVDSEITLAEVPKAHALVSGGHKRGNLGVRVQ